MTTTKEKVLRWVYTLGEARPIDVERMSGLSGKIVCVNLSRLRNQLLLESVNIDKRAVVYNVTSVGRAYLRYKDEFNKATGLRNS